MNVSEYSRYFSPTVGVRSGLEADVGPMTHVILCLIKSVALRVELSRPLDSVLLGTLLGHAALGDAGSRHFFPGVCHRCSNNDETVMKNGGDRLLFVGVEVVVSCHEGVVGRFLVTEISVSPLLHCVRRAVPVTVGAVRVGKELVLLRFSLHVFPASAGPPARHKLHFLLLKQLV